MAFIYKTTDGQTFSTETEAQAHQATIDRASSSSNSTDSFGTARGRMAEAKELNDHANSIYGAYKSGNWKWLANKEASGICGVLGELHLGKIKVKDAFYQIVNDLYQFRNRSSSGEIKTITQYEEPVIDLFKLAKQVWEQKNKRPMTEKDFLKESPEFYDSLAYSAINFGILLYNHQEYEFAFYLWLITANIGNANAMNNVAFCYEKGTGVPQDKAKALEWYKKLEAVDSERGKKAIAALQNTSNPETDALVNDGVAAYNAQDYAKAVELWRKAADMGDAQAMSNLGSCYGLGNGVPQDNAKAVEWKTKAANLGNAGAQQNLGSYYENGTIIAKDVAKAIELYKKAAAQGNVKAQQNLRDKGISW